MKPSVYLLIQPWTPSPFLLRCRHVMARPKGVKREGEKEGGGPKVCKKSTLAPAYPYPYPLTDVSGTVTVTVATTTQKKFLHGPWAKAQSHLAQVASHFSLASSASRVLKFLVGAEKSQDKEFPGGRLCPKEKGKGNRGPRKGGSRVPCKLPTHLPWLDMNPPPPKIEKVRTCVYLPVCISIFRAEQTPFHHSLAKDQKSSTLNTLLKSVEDRS